MTSPLYGAAPDLDRYPIGPLQPKGALTAAEREAELARIGAAPKALRKAVEGMSDAQLDTPYRAGGWNIRQVVHHLADSHMNAYVRVKLALTESNPTIKPYDESLWAELADARMPVETSLVLLEKLHERLVAVIRSLRPEDFSKTFFHPEHKRTLSLDELLSMYAWHGEHHIAHIAKARSKKK